MNFHAKYQSWRKSFNLSFERKDFCVKNYRVSIYNFGSNVNINLFILLTFALNGGLRGRVG